MFSQVNFPVCRDPKEQKKRQVNDDRVRPLVLQGTDHRAVDEADAERKDEAELHRMKFSGLTPRSNL